MKLVQSLIVAAVLAVPAVSSFAQSNAPITRAEVRAQLVQIEKAGYQPGRNDPNYPADIQAAEARVAAQNGAAASFGGATDGTSAAGTRAVVSPALNNNAKSIYFGH
jgi:anti-sigma factor RsiW